MSGTPPPEPAGDDDSNSSWIWFLVACSALIVVGLVSG